MKFLKTHTGAMVVLAVVIVLSVLLGSHRSLVQARERVEAQFAPIAGDLQDCLDITANLLTVAESWGGIGDESLNNGFLLVYAVGENKVWAMAGSGIEDALPASKIEGWLEADFYGGYDAGE